MKLLGYKQIEVRPMAVKDAEHQLNLEISENETRKDFSKSERINYARRLERIKFLESIKSRGVIEPIVITLDKVIVSGHQRVRACKELGIDTVMCDVHTYNNEDDILCDMLYSNIDRIKEIPSNIKKIKIAMETERILKTKEQKIKETRDEIVKGFRNEVTKNKKRYIKYHSKQCDICNFNFDELLEIHHILPLQQGGNNSFDNISCLCPNCHSIMHKYIFSYCNNVEIPELEDWIKNNYTLTAHEKIIELYIKFIKKKMKYGWEKLTWT